MENNEVQQGMAFGNFFFTFWSSLTLAARIRLLLAFIWGI